MTDQQTEPPIKKKDETEIEKERYRVFIEEVADAFYETDLTGNFTFFNKALCRIFGYAEAKIHGHNYREFMDEKNAEIAFTRLNAVYRTGKGDTDITWEIIREDGEVRILEISASLILDHTGEKLGFRGIARDITEKHLALQALVESEQCAYVQYQASRRAERRHRALLDFLPDPVFVFNPDETVSYVNPAFEKVFGWTLAELEGRRIPFVPDDLKEETRQGFRRLFQEKMIHGFETRRLTRDGRLLDIVLDGAIFYEPEADAPAGQVILLRDVTREKRAARSNQALFRIARALPRFQLLDALLEFITKEVKALIGVAGASVILIDEDAGEFFFRAATYDRTETGQNLKEVRFPLSKGVAGRVYETGEPLIVPDTSESEFFFQKVDEQSKYRTRNMLDVPIWTQDCMIGVLCAVNKKEGKFDHADTELLNAVASTVALPIENARINEELRQSYDEVRSLNRAKERVIHHLSHELKTPVSILEASLSLLRKKLSGLEKKGWKRILDRADRNLNRILEMQYQIEDILKKKDYRTLHMLTTLLDTCSDHLEVLFESRAREAGYTADTLVRDIRDHIEASFSPREAPCQKIRLDHFTEKKIHALVPGFAHRQLCFEVRNLMAESHEPVSILIPPEVLSKIMEGLIRNAVENTPDSGQIEVILREGKRGPEFEVRDFGVGITAANQRLIFESNLSTRETLQYSSRKPYDFNAGGKGFDLLRMKIFSERYNFRIEMQSQRCGFIPEDENLCPGKIEDCEHCHSVKDCLISGGTRVLVRFRTN